MNEGVAISFVPEHDLNLLHILELFITRRLERKRLKGFDYRAPIPRTKPGEKPLRRDWRKRTREIEAKKSAQPAKPVPRGPQKPAAKRGKR